MATQVGTAYVQIIPSAKGIKGKIQDELGGDAESAGKSVGGTLGSTIKGALAAAGIGAAFSKTIGEGAALEQSIGGIETLFKDSSDKMQKYASQAYKTAGVSANTYMENVTSFSASLLQSVGGNTAKAADAANMAMIDMSDNANKMGTNIQDIQNAYQGFSKQNYTMLDNLKLGYGGTQKEMQRLLKDAQKITGQKYDISNLNDVYSAIHAIQGKLDITGTTAKEAASTLSGSFESMKAAFSDFLGRLTLGQDITPSLQALVQTASTYLFGNLIPAVGNIVKALPGAMKTFLAAGIPTLISSGSQLIGGLITGLQTGGPKLLTSISGSLDQAIAWIRNSLPTMLATGQQMLSTLATGFLQNVPTLISSLGTIKQQLLQALLTAAPQLMTAASQLISQIATAFQQNAPQILQSLLSVLGQLAITIVQNAPQILASAFNLALSIASGILKGNGSVLSAIGSLLTSLGSKILEYAPSLLSAGGRLIAGLANGISNTASSVWNAAKSVAEKLLKPIETVKDKIKGIIEKIKDFFNFKVSMPKIPVPHFGISPSGWRVKDLLSGTIPHLSVKWYAKGGVFDGPSVIGVGEAGPEAVVPLTALWQNFTAMADSVVNGVGTMLAASSGGGAGTIHITLNLWPNGPKAGEWIVNTYDEYKRKKGTWN